MALIEEAHGCVVGQTPTRPRSAQILRQKHEQQSVTWTGGLTREPPAGSCFNYITARPATPAHCLQNVNRSHAWRVRAD
jgi:hypothetical protein